MNMPKGWKEALLAEMDRRFEICRVAGRFDDDALCIDDTQIGVEFAIDHFEKMLAAAPTPPAPAHEGSKLREVSGSDEVGELAAAAGKRTRVMLEPEVALPDDFIGSVKRLAFIARTSGGVAGRDRDLCAALSRVEAMLEAIYDPDWQKGMRQGVAPEVDPVGFVSQTMIDGLRAGKRVQNWILPKKKDDPDFCDMDVPLYTHADDGLRKAAEELIAGLDNGSHCLTEINNLRAELDKGES